MVQNRGFTENLIIICERSSALRQYNLYSLQLRQFTSTFQFGVCPVVFSWCSVSDASYWMIAVVCYLWDQMSA
jgi:hypothetical protein